MKKPTARAARKKATFARYSAADYLKTEADMVAYLRACAEEGDPALIAVALGDIARAAACSGLPKKRASPARGSTRR